MMISRAVAVEFVRAATAGRTGPLLLVCENGAGEHVELFCKLSAGCDQGVINLARETVAVCLAADIHLPVPVPYIVEITEDFVQSITDPDIKLKFNRSAPTAFGSTRASQFSAWLPGNRISNAMVPTALSALVFDGIIQNPDRRHGNPNCLVKGDEIRLIDHELAFAHRLILGWRPPWAEGGLHSLTVPDHRHIFVDDLHGRELDFGPIAAAWTGLSDERIRDYEVAVPREWDSTGPDVAAALALISDARDNIAACIAEARRILS